MGATLSASGLARAHNCPAAFALPVVREESSNDAKRGTLVHTFLELVSSGVAPKAAATQIADPEARELCERLDLRSVPTDGEAEVRLAYHTRTGIGRRLPGEGHRDYAALEPEEIAGTADLVCWNEDPVRVVDWKTARYDHDVEQSRPQLELYALAVARLAGLSLVRWAVGVISDEGTIGWFSADLNEDALANVAARARETWERVQFERAERARLGAAYEPDVSLGWWCKWCSAYRACPALRREVQTVTGRFVAEVKDHDFGDAYVNALLVEKATDAVRKSTKRVVQHRGLLPTGDGREISCDSRGALRVRRAT